MWAIALNQGRNLIFHFQRLMLLCSQETNYLTKPFVVRSRQITNYLTGQSRQGSNYLTGQSRQRSNYLTGQPRQRSNYLTGLSHQIAFPNISSHPDSNDYSLLRLQGPDFYLCYILFISSFDMSIQSSAQIIWLDLVW